MEGEKKREKAAMRWKGAKAEAWVGWGGVKIGWY